MRGLVILSVLLTILVGFWWVIYVTGLLEVILGAGVLAISWAVGLDRIRYRGGLEKQGSRNISASGHGPR